jgi:uncharacterized protein (DUF2141 family)
LRSPLQHFAAIRPFRRLFHPQPELPGKTMSVILPVRATAAAVLCLGVLALPGIAQAQYRQEIANDASRCARGPAVRITVTGIKSSAGTMRVQLYRGTREDWLESGRWLRRIETRAQAGTMSFCMPVSQAGTYAIAVRHDVNGNGKTDLSQDGGGMSNNPSINIFNLGKPSYTKTAFPVGGDEVKALSIRMRYM